MARLLLIRHGQSLWNVEARIQGQLDVPLSELGARQAELVARRLQPVPLAAVYVSPLRRACATAEAVARPHGLPVIPVPELTEIDHGEWQGRTMVEIAAADRERLALWTLLPGRVQMPNGERLYDVRRRSYAVIQDLMTKHRGQTVAVVSHEVVIKVAVAEVLGMDYDHLSRLAIDNAALTIVDFADERPHVVTLNDTAHLDGLRAEPFVIG